MVSEQPAANRISINAAEQDDRIESVTVFQANNAEVKRRVKLELKQGQNHVDIERLPTCINEDSIRVDGTGSAVIFDVVYHSPYRQSTPPALDNPQQEAIAESYRALEALQSERQFVKQQSGHLESYAKTLGSGSVSIGDAERLLDMFVPRQVAAAKRIQELDALITLAEKEHNNARAKIPADARDAKRSTKITVTVLAEVDGPAELLLTYVVSNASWTPLYDLRASIAKSPDDPSKVALHYRASITQSTGEDWPDVALTLSTASPQLGSDIPSLSAWRVGLPQTSPLRTGASPRGLGESDEAAFRSFAYSPTSPQFSPASPTYSPVSPAYSPTSPTYVPPRVPTMAYRPAQVASAGVLSASFEISGRSGIPSDESSHKVVIAVLDLETELEWVCIPREKECVFLRCKVVNSSEFTLLPGEASVFVDDNFVSKSKIEHVAPSDPFKTSLGVDSALRVSYPAMRTLNRTINQPIFFFGANPAQSVAAHSQRITIRNSRLAPVTALHVFDHVPISTDARVKVEVLSPNSLGPITGVGLPTDGEVGEDKKDQPWASVQKGVKARWANLDVGGEGTVEWECEVQPNEELGLELAWEVSAPVGQKWVNM
ncbi:hypothetical protein FRC08_013899 [Ceratobasidium sp. 394]|nr:hypothetical protein FRC08_013899 [Ceratobasidium sp. 394]